MKKITWCCAILNLNFCHIKIVYINQYFFLKDRTKIKVVDKNGFRLAHISICFSPTLPSVLSESDILSEIELAASDLVKASVSGRIRLDIDDVVFPSRFGVGGNVAPVRLFLICELYRKLYLIPIWKMRNNTTKEC